MTLFQPSQAQKFTPTTIKFSKLYRHNTRGGKLGDNILVNVKSSLRQAGYTDSQIADIITADKPVPVSQMKDVAGILNRSRVYGFEKDPIRAVKTYLNKERIKAQSIAHIRKEHILEAAEENLANVGTTSLNQKAIGPNTGKPGQASVFSRRRNSAATYSLSGKSGSEKTGSLKSHEFSTTISRPGMGQGGSTGGGISIKPKF